MSFGFSISREDQIKLMATIFRIEKDFEYYTGIFFPKDIIEHSGSWLLGKVKPINETHVKQLKDLVSLGERLLSNNWGSLLAIRDVLPFILKYSSEMNLHVMRLVSVAFSQEAQKYCYTWLRTSEIIDPENKKLQSNFKIKIKLLSERDLTNFINFLKDKKNAHLAKRIDFIYFGVDIDFSISVQQRELFELLSKKCPNLTRLFFKDLKENTNLKLEGLIDLTEIRLENISGNLTLNLPKLSIFSCENIIGHLTIIDPENLSSFSCRKISEDAQLTLPQNFDSSCLFHFSFLNQKALVQFSDVSFLSCFSIYLKDINTLSTFTKLTSFQCEALNQDIFSELSTLPNLSSASFKMFGSSFIFDGCPSGKKFKIENWKSLSSLSFEFIGYHVKVKVRNLPKLSCLTIKKIYNSELELQNLPELFSISISSLMSKLRFKNLPKLSLLSCENIRDSASLELKDLPELRSLSCNNIEEYALIRLSKGFPKLVYMYLCNTQGIVFLDLPLPEELPKLQYFLYNNERTKQRIFKYDDYQKMANPSGAFIVDKN